MSNNAQKLPLGRSLNQVARNRALDEVHLTGKSLPCSVVSRRGQIVQVKFELADAYTLQNVTIPVASSIYAQAPLQPGDKGVAIAADAYLGGVSGLGGGTADLSRRGNLTALLFVPLANSTWTAPLDPGSYLLQGPNGVVLQDLGAACIFKLTPSGLTITVGGMVCTINAAGLTVTGGEVDADGIGLKTHKHISATPGSATSASIAGAGP